jgi:hypothetical protein
MYTTLPMFCGVQYLVRLKGLIPPQDLVLQEFVLKGYQAQLANKTPAEPDKKVLRACHSL